MRSALAVVDVPPPSAIRPLRHHAPQDERSTARVTAAPPALQPGLYPPAPVGTIPTTLIKPDHLISQTYYLIVTKTDRSGIYLLMPQDTTDIHRYGHKEHQIKMFMRTEWNG